MTPSLYMTKKQVIILLAISIFGGFLLGSAATYILLSKQQDQGTITLGQDSEHAKKSSSASIPGDGVYLLKANKATQINHTFKSQSFDINLVPSTSTQTPEIAIQGNDFPVGQLVLRAFRAGFGIDAEFSNLGATVKTVFDGSPAQQAGIQPGDLIVKVDGEPPRPPTAFMPGHVDVFGPMEPLVVVDLVRGTTSAQLKMARTYLHPAGPFEEAMYHLSEDLSVTPKGSYVVLTPKRPLKPGVYRLEVQSKEVNRVGESIFPSSATSTPSPVPPEFSLYYWIFLVTR